MESTTATMKIYNLFVKHLNGKTLTLKFQSPTISSDSIKSHLFHLTGIPPHHQRLITGKRLISDEENSTISCSHSSNTFPTVHLLLRLNGGKGGFGSLLRGAATKAGQKKTNNFDACRDMSGRRLRHVNAEKRLQEWKESEEERKLEKVAEEFLKKQMKKGKKGKGDGEAHKYVAKYREESERCTADVALSVKEALINGNNGKRKGDECGNGDAKKLKIWMGKRKMNGSDSDYSSGEENDDEGGNDKSILLNSQNESDSNKDDGSSGSVTGRKHGVDSSGSGSCESGSEEEKETVVEVKVESVGPHSSDTDRVNAVEPVLCNEMVKPMAMVYSEAVVFDVSAENNGHQGCNVVVSDKLDGALSQASDITSSENVAGASKCIGVDLENKASVNVEISPSIPTIEESLNFGAFSSAAELEVLGLERLKSELQSCGLKCGGTLQERAARLFLLKSTPLDKLPKKLLAKK
ncbi:putative Sde2 domain-containing protein [Lupinus albus]|uniref:Putative Sde2 domain-containing protein n=1 Tax=Lupinus albus TaxID=3870 RepID=A0A6A4NN72_LUPAL|nr:putative Sde2 domain-containing protein [Lupinus albus]